MTSQMRWPCRAFMLHSCISVLLLVCAASAQWHENVLYSFQGGSDGAFPAGGVVFDSQGNLYGATEDGGSPSCGGPGQCGTVFELSPPAEKGEEWTESVLYVFKGRANNDGETPGGGIVIDAVGNLYGTTEYGGTGPCTLLGANDGCGTVYELSPPAKQGDPWTETVLYNFQGGKDGYVPSGDLTLDDQGNLYGVTLFGGGEGTNCGDDLYPNCGTVWRLNPPKTKDGAWREKVLHRFAGGKDGAWPNGGLVLDSCALYGTTYYGGQDKGECYGGTGCGTVFKLNAPMEKDGEWRDNTLFRFHGNDGATPAAGVVFGKRGLLYGTAFAGGDSGNGVVFSLEKSNKCSNGWTEAVLYRFKGEADGDGPLGGILVNAQGDLYGTVSSSNRTAGNVFELKPDSRPGNIWSFRLLYGFKGPPDGVQPAAAVVSKGTALYGTTLEGGTSNNCSFYGCGVVFEIKP